MNSNQSSWPEHFVFPILRREKGTGLNFNLADFAKGEQRRIDRLIRAAYGVGHTKPEFLKMTRAQQELMVLAWVDEALESRAIRLGQLHPR